MRKSSVSAAFGSRSLIWISFGAGIGVGGGCGKEHSEDVGWW